MSSKGLGPAVPYKEWLQRSWQIADDAGCSSATSLEAPDVCLTEITDNINSPLAPSGSTDKTIPLAETENTEAAVSKDSPPM